MSESDLNMLWYCFSGSWSAGPCELGEEFLSLSDADGVWGRLDSCHYNACSELPVLALVIWMGNGELNPSTAAFILLMNMKSLMIVNSKEWFERGKKMFGNLYSEKKTSAISQGQQGAFQSTGSCTWREDDPLCCRLHMGCGVSASRRLLPAGVPFVTSWSRQSCPAAGSV